MGEALQALILIGMNMDEAALRKRLDACLLKEVETSQGYKT